MLMKNNITLDITKPAPLYHIVKGKILELIRQNVLKDGDRLPPEEEIAKENKISIGTVRTALLELAREGIITRYTKRGSFVTLKKSSNSVKIGIISPFPSLTKEGADFYRTELWGGIQEGFVNTGATLLFSRNELKNGKKAGVVFKERVDGLLFLVPLRTQENLMEELKEKGLPLMVAGATPKNGLNFVGVDNQKGVEAAVGYLAKMGHAKVGAVFSGIEHFDGFWRYQGYLSSLEKFSLPLRKNWVKIIRQTEPKTWTEEAARLTKEILNDTPRPTVILAGGGFVALGVKEGIEETGLKIPEDVSLISFDDFHLAQYLVPPLTTIAQPIWQMGELAIKKLVEIIKNETAQPCQIILKPELMIRDSVRNLKKTKPGVRA